MLHTKTLKIAKYQQENPCLTLEQIGEKFNVSKQRVHQILNQFNIKKKRYNVNTICPVCKSSKRPQSKTCWKCFINNHRVQLNCFICNKSFTRIQGSLIENTNRTGQLHVFCGKVCQGKWLGTTYGRGHKKE